MRKEILNNPIIADKIRIANLLPETSQGVIIHEIVSGLKMNPKQISPKYFYDALGSKLFNEITHLDEYYPSRTEKLILKNLMLKVGQGKQNLIEIGSGDSSKITLLLNNLSAQQRAQLRYIPIDVSESAMRIAAQDLTLKFPELQIDGKVLDFTRQLNLFQSSLPSIYCFLGGTIGNFNLTQSHALLQSIATIMRSNDAFYLGFDLLKERKLIYNAYNDKKGVTAGFNKNILTVVNRHIQSDFDLNNFDHLAFFNEEFSRIEMHLVANKTHKVQSPNMPEAIKIEKEEHIITEYSYKYTLEQMADLALLAGLKMVNKYTDKKNWFAVGEFVKK